MATKKPFPIQYYALVLELQDKLLVEIPFITPELAQDFRTHYINFINFILDISNKNPQQTHLAQILAHTSVKTLDTTCILKLNQKPNTKSNDKPNT